MLLAALARLSKVTGISHQLKMQPVTSKSKIIPVVKEDLGESIHRIGNALLTPAKASQSYSKVSKEKPMEKPTEDGVSKSSSKRKKKKNAIDDLFSGLF